MELLLNLTWFTFLLVALAATEWTVRCRRTHLSRGKALGCVALLAILLFPLVSITDDLSQTALASEAAGRHVVTADDGLPDFGAAVRVELAALVPTGVMGWSFGSGSGRAQDSSSSRFVSLQGAHIWANRAPPSLHAAAIDAA